MGLFDILPSILGTVLGGAVGGPVGAVAGGALATSLFGASPTPGIVAQPGSADFVGPVQPAAALPSGQTAAGATLQTLLNSLSGGLIPRPALGGAAITGFQAAAGRQALSAPGGNGQRFRTTIVITQDVDTGRILRTEILKGAPFLMNNDVRKLSTISRKVSKANSKIPRKTVRESATTQLKNAAVDSALRNVLSTCPPKPC